MKAILGLGGNEGDRLSFLREAIRRLAFQVAGLRVLRASPLYESQAMLPADAPADGSWNRPFLNLAIEVELSLAPQETLGALKKVERALGREDRSRWAPRRIDIDVLAFEEGKFSGAGLEVPHPGLLERPFALLPLADLWPDWIHPSKRRSARELAGTWRTSSPGAVPFATQVSPLPLAELVGILNITPDSFSDGGLLATPEQALAQGEALIAQGATVLDIGAESTRPTAEPLSVEEEWRRLAPVLEAVRELGKRAKLSVDTRHAEVARRAVNAGAAWINDVEGLESREMQKLAVGTEVGLVLMHSLGIPPDTKRVLKEGESPAAQVFEWGSRKLRAMKELGIAPERVILDPGIGFGKLAFQSWSLLAEIEKLHELGARLLVGHSRKSFLGLVTDLPARERDVETAVLSAELGRRGVQFIRVHDVGASARALRAAQRLDGITRWR